MKKYFLLIIVCVAFMQQAFSTQRIWKGTSSNSWNTAGNWSPSGVPGASDTAVFDNTCTSCNCTINATVNVKMINMKSTYTGTVTQGSSIIGTSGFIMAGGTFTGGTGSITMNGVFTMSGGTFTATSGSLYFINSGYTYTGGTFNNNSGTVYVEKANTFSGSLTFYNLYFSGGDTYATTATISSGTMTVNGTLTGGGSSTSTVTAGYINANGNITMSSYGLMGSTTINIVGSGNQTFTGGSNVPNISINKSGGTLTLSSTIYVNGNWAYTAGTISAGSSLLYFNSGATISGSHTVNSVTLYNTATSTVTISSGTTLSLTGNLNLAGSVAPAINTGTINVAGNVYAQSVSTSGGGTGSIVLNGSSSQTIYGNTSGTNQLCNLAINKSGGDVTIDSTINVYAGGLSFLDGTANYKLLATHGGTINLPNGNITMSSNCHLNRGTATINITGYNNAQTLSGSGKGILPNVVINKNHAIHVSSILTISGTVAAGGDWTFLLGGLSITNSKVIFDPANKQHIIGTHTLNKIGFNNTTASLDSVIIRSGTTLTANDTIFFSGTSGIKIDSAGTISAKGNIVITNTTTTGGGSSTINVNGTSNQTIVGTSASTALPLCNLTISKSTGTLTINGTSVAAGGSVTCTSGTTTVNSSNTFYLYNTASINAPAITFNNVNIATGSRSLTGNLNMNGNLTIPSSTTLTAAGTANAITLQGNWSNSGKFISGTGYVNFTGSNSQTISQPGGTTDSIANLYIKKPSNNLTLSSVVNISDSLKFNKGNIVSDTTHLLVLWKRAKTGGYSDTSFVSGPVKKIGNTAFTFPLGKNTNAQSIAISAPTVVTDAFQAEYFDTNPTTVYGVYTDTTFNYVSTCQYFKLLRKSGTSNITPTLGYDLTSCVSNLLPAPRVIGYNGTKWKDLGMSNLTYSPSGGNISTATTVTQYGAFTLGNYNPLITNTPNGDTCFAAIVMPDSTTSILSGQTQSTAHRWYTFTPKTTEIKVTLTNTNLGSNHIHDIMLFEGACLRYQGAGHDSAWRDTTLTLTLHEVQVGTPYFIETFRERSNCSLCSASSANFKIEVQHLPTPVQTVTNNVVYLNGHPSHMAEQVVIRVNKMYLNATNVNNTSLKSGTAVQFFDTAVINSIAYLLYNSNVGLVNGLAVQKVYPNMTFADTLTLSRDSQLVHQSALFETFILSLPKNTKLFWTSRILTFSNKVKYSLPNMVMTLTGAPDDPFYGMNQDNLHDGTGTYPDANINAEGAWDIETGKSFINIGVYDTGIDQTHVELSGKVIDGWNYTGSSYGSGLISGTCDDGVGHGTSCAGIIGAIRNNTIGFAGIAGGNDSISNIGCSLYDMKIFDSQGTPASSANLARAIQEGATAYGLHVMNNSYANFDGVFDLVLHDAVESAVQNGVIFVASRGNYLASGTSCSNGPSNYSMTDIAYPSCFADYMVINVGASGSDGIWKSPLNGDAGDPCDNDVTSMTGNNVDVIAPGTTLVVTKTTASACEPGGITSDYTPFNATSSAAAHVSGVAGLILSQANSSSVAPDNLAIEDVEWILQKSANNRSSGTGHYDSENGWGIINAGTALSDIKNGVFKIQHFAMNDSKGTTYSGGKGNMAYALGVPITLSQPYDTLDAGSYTGNIWQYNFQLNYTLDDPGDVVWAGWPRYSASSGWSPYHQPLSPDNWCQLVNFNNHEANLVTYQYQVMNDVTGPADPWYPVNIYVGFSLYTYNSTTGINKYNYNNTTFSVHPNPTQEKATIDITITKPEKVLLEIYDMQGTLIKTIANEKLQEGNHVFHVSVFDIAQGVYQIKLSTETLYSTQKLIVVR